MSPREHRLLHTDTDVSIPLIDEKDHFRPIRIEEYWRQTLKTLVQFGHWKNMYKLLCFFY